MPMEPFRSNQGCKHWNGLEAW